MSHKLRVACQSGSDTSSTIINKSSSYLVKKKNGIPISYLILEIGNSCKSVRSAFLGGQDVVLERRGIFKCKNIDT